MSGLLLVGHGSHLNGDSSAPVRQHAAAIKRLGLFDEVRMAFWKEEPSLSRGLDPFVAKDVTVVPVFISAGYFTNEVIPREMGLRPTGRSADADGAAKGHSAAVSDVRGMRVTYTDPVGSHPALANVVLQRAREAGGRPGDALAVLGHGTPRNPDSERNVFEQTERVRQMGAFGEVVTVFLDQEPNMRDVLALTTCETVVIVPLFIADGWHVGETIPEDLALDGPETRREGRRVRYAGAVGTHPSVVDVILELANARTAGGRDGDRGVRAYPSPVEAVPEGCSVRFGQFEVHREAGSFSLGPAGHDRLGNGEEIAVDDVADRCRSDDLGRYRPLASALTMPTGWYARFKDRAQAGEALDDAYPLARLHCLEWIEGTLRVVGVDEVLSRQSGRYANAGRLSPSGREAARRVLCDERCDLSPVWAEEAEVDQREAPQERVSRGEVPCPEPCSVFVSLCREAELWEHDPPEPAPVDERIAWAAFDEPGNEVREAYLQRRFGDRVTSDE